jgi:hypothetical protein
MSTITNDNVARVLSARTNYELLCNVEIVMGLTCVLPMLEAIQSSSKVAQNIDTFICDYVADVKLCQA